MLPNFLLIGGMKCGTSSLARQLDAHPQIHFSPRKEIHFFSREENWARGQSWYESHFRDAKGELAIGEGSTSYAMYPLLPGVPARIAQTVPDVRFVYLVRHPLERIISNHRHQWLVEEGPWTFQQDVDKPLEESWRTHPQYLPCSRYYFQIEQYLQHFAPERFLILVFEEFKANPVAVHKQVYDFLGVDPTFEPTDLRPRNVTARRVREAAWMRVLRRVPGAKALGKVLLPEHLRIRVTALGGETAPRVGLSESARQDILSELREDIVALSDFAKRDFRKIWNLPID
jgi:hypothetical protein